MTFIKNIRLVFSSVLCDAGEATHALELAKGIREDCPRGYEVEIIFLSTGSPFEKKIRANGFSVYPCSPHLLGFQRDLKPTKRNLIGEVELAYELLKGEIEALETLKPDLVLYGFYPIASLARRMVLEPIPGICYLPIPMEAKVFSQDLMKDLPDSLKLLTYLPLKLRQKLMAHLPKALKMQAPILKQSNILKALYQYGWEGEKINDLFDMLRSDLYLINDLPRFYKGINLPESFKLVGPLYARPEAATLNPKMSKLLAPEFKGIKLFCTLGSSGDKQHLLEAIKAIKPEWHAVVLVPPAICSLKEAKACVANEANSYLTDEFVPAEKLNQMADVVISHGGQGTVQTAIASGTPLVGFGMQVEQQINLEHIESYGAGLRIPYQKWKAPVIQKAIEEVVGNPSYRTKMAELSKELHQINGKRKAAEVIWTYILQEFQS